MTNHILDLLPHYTKPYPRIILSVNFNRNNLTSWPKFGDILKLELFSCNDVKKRITEKQVVKIIAITQRWLTTHKDIGVGSSDRGVLWKLCLLFTYYSDVTWASNQQQLYGLFDSMCRLTTKEISSTLTQITGVSIVYSTVFSGTDQRKHQSSMSLAGHRAKGQ